MIGIISGEGSLPKVLINNFYKHNIKFLVINLSKIKILKKNFYNLNTSQFSKILKTLKDNNCKEVIMAGKVTRPRIQDIKIDFKLIKMLPKIIASLKNGDSHALDFVIKILKNNNIRVVSCLKYAPELKAENFTLFNKESKQDIEDINKGIKLLNHINNKFDVGQSIIVNNGFIVGIEAAELLFIISIEPLEIWTS